VVPAGAAHPGVVHDHWQVVRDHVRYRRESVRAQGKAPARDTHSRPGTASRPASRSPGHATRDCRRADESRPDATNPGATRAAAGAACAHRRGRRFPHSGGADVRRAGRPIFPRPSPLRRVGARAGGGGEPLDRVQHRARNAGVLDAATPPATKRCTPAWTPWSAGSSNRAARGRREPGAGMLGFGAPGPQVVHS